MAAYATVSQLSQSRNLLVPRLGVATLYGYGISVSVDRGHLILKDHIGGKRREGRFARVGHNLRRIILVGSDGFVSLSALRWLADQDAAFVMLERDGSVLAATGPVRPSDARLRRAQALAHSSSVALDIARELISQKIEAQHTLVKSCLKNDSAAMAIEGVGEALANARTIDEVRLLESRAASAYWGAWRNLPINFPKRDLHRVPEHWRTFRARVSPLTGSPRLAASPPNAILNYLYAVLESETRLAVAAVGLDPGLGFLHVDTPARDSLACDVMEAVRPKVDAYVLDWIISQILRREWFFEQRDGNCRLMGSFAARLSETASTWAAAVAPVAEWVARTLWATIAKRPKERAFPTRLTQARKREAKGKSPNMKVPQLLRQETFCRDCGVQITQGHTRCVDCAMLITNEALVEAAKIGRIAAQSETAQTLRAATQSRHATARWRWQASDLPAWLSEEVFKTQIQPRLKQLSLSALALALEVSMPYAVDVRKGRRIPHPRHWATLARIVNVSSPSEGS